jgi:hypothetical protein
MLGCFMKYILHRQVAKFTKKWKKSVATYFSSHLHPNFLFSLRPLRLGGSILVFAFGQARQFISA